MEKLNVAIADDNERMLRLLGAIIERWGRGLQCDQDKGTGCCLA